MAMDRRTYLNMVMMIKLCIHFSREENYGTHQPTIISIIYDQPCRGTLHHYQSIPPAESRVSLALMITLLEAPPYHPDTCFLAGLRLNELGAGPGPDTDNGPSNRAHSSSESAMSPTELRGADASRRSCWTTRGTAATTSAAYGVGSRGAAGRPSVAPLPALPWTPAVPWALAWAAGSDVFPDSTNSNSVRASMRGEASASWSPSGRLPLIDLLTVLWRGSIPD